MATQTPNYNLDLYETGDAAALTDQYNSAMHKIDSDLKTFNQGITSASQQATNAKKVADANTAKLNALGATDTNTATAFKNKINTTATTADANTAKLNALGVTNTTSADNLKYKINATESTANANKANLNALGVTNTTNANDLKNKINTTATTANQAKNTADANTAKLNALGATDPNTATALKNKIDTTATTAQNNQTNITNINKYIKVNEMFNMRGDNIMVTFGDSYASPTDNTSWAVQTASALGWTLKNYAIGGAGYIEPNTTYQSEFNTAKQDKTYDHNKVSLVIIGGSRNSNDGYSGTIKTAATALFQQCTNEYPNARIITIPMLWDSKTVSDYWRYNAGEIEQAAIETGIESIPWAWTWNMGKPDNIKPDKIHPNEKGTTIIKNYILRYLTGTYTGRHEHWVWRKPNNPAAGMLSVNASGGTISYAFQMLSGVTASEWTSISGLPQWAWGDSDNTNAVHKWTLQISNGANEATLFKINEDGTFGIQPFTTTGVHGSPNGLMAGHFTTAW